MDLYHYTDRDGHNAIRSQVSWTFKAHNQRAPHLPFGAFFTTLHWNAPAFFPRTRLPRDKRAFYFQFLDTGDLKALDGDRGRYVFYSPSDYTVSPDRQRSEGATGL